MNKKMIAMRAAIAFLALGYLAWGTSAGAYTINDNTLVGQGTTKHTETTFRWMDHVDDNPNQPSGSYNIFGIDTSFSTGALKISLYSNFDGYDKAGNIAITLADLALDLNLDGTYEYGVSLTARQNGIVSGRLYGNAGWKTSKYYLEGRTYDSYDYGEAWGDNDHNPLHKGQSPIVHLASGTSLGSVNFGIPFQTELDGYPAYLYELSIPLALFGDNFKNEIGIFWAGSTCANDIIEGTASVPVPPSILLLSSGLLGMFAINRRRISTANALRAGSARRSQK